MNQESASTPGPDGRGTGPASSSEESAAAPESGQPSAAQIAQQYAARAGVERGADGQIDVLASVGGIRGLAEAVVPGLLFTVLFTAGVELIICLAVAVASAGVFSIASLLSRRPLMQSLTGVIGVLICALFALNSGSGSGYFLPGFYTNGAYVLAFIVSIAVRWPVAGLLFGFIRGEGVEWRASRSRMRSYQLATWIIASVFALRLAVQLPLFLADNVAALGTLRLAMGVPLYALGLWLAWMVSRPRVVADAPAAD